MKKIKINSLLALFDDLKHIKNERVLPTFTKEQVLDYNKALSFLKSYTGSLGTFNTYRREIERLLQWSWHIAKKTIKELRREDIENFINFCQKPPKSWSWR
jgi:site-specific recombinase XerC